MIGRHAACTEGRTQASEACLAEAAHGVKQVGC